MITLRDVGCRHGAAAALDHVSGVFAPGLTAIAGPNGAGKTTLLRAIAGLQPVCSGTIDRGGLAARDVALLPQASLMDRRFPVTCAELVALGGFARLGAWQGASPIELGRVACAIEAVGLAGFEHRLIGALSAGQFQRVLLARLMVQDARVILLDEPTTAIDAATEAMLIATLRHWAGEDRIVIAATHDTGLILREFPTTVLLSRQVVAWGASADVLTEAHLRAAQGGVERRDLAA
jgi:zinc/manganese transport system ATP-binding protein